jgi:hypothetical protein
MNEKLTVILQHIYLFLTLGMLTLKIINPINDKSIDSQHDIFIVSILHYPV